MGHSSVIAKGKRFEFYLAGEMSSGTGCVPAQYNVGNRIWPLLCMLCLMTAGHHRTLVRGGLVILLPFRPVNVIEHNISTKCVKYNIMPLSGLYIASPLHYMEFGQYCGGT